MLEHRSLDPKGAALALLLAGLWGANPVTIKLSLSALLVVAGIALTMRR